MCLPFFIPVWRSAYLVFVLLLFLFYMNSSLRTMQSVVTGQAPITLEWKITSGGKQIKTEDNAVYLRQK